MNKEINIKIPGQILDYVDTKEHLLDLFNYITNLQQENERLKEWKKDLLNENIELENIRKEAIEYIENPRHEMSVLTYQNLLKILQNGGENK